MRRARTWMAVTVLAACSGRSDLDGSRRPIPGLTAPARTHELLRSGEHVLLDLYDGRASAVVVEDGALTVSGGTADLAKYIDGGYRWRWHLGRVVDGRRSVMVDGLSGEFSLPVDADPGGVLAGAAAGARLLELDIRPLAPGQAVSVLVNQRRIADLALPQASWGRYRVALPADALLPGDNQLRLHFRHVGVTAGLRSAAALSRVALGGAGGGAGLQVSAVTRAGRRLDALGLRRRGRLSFYLLLPASSSELVLAATGTAPVHVAISEEGRGPRTLWSVAASATWRDARIPIAAHAGKVVRLDLVGAGAADWGRPVLVGAAPAPVPALVPAPADHVVVWTISGLRADRVGSPAATPALSRLARHGRWYRRASSVSSWVGVAQAALMTGRHLAGAAIPEGATTLAERFRDAGFYTALVSGSAAVTREHGFAQGVTHYENLARQGLPHRGHNLWRVARQVFQRHGSERVFLYMVSTEPQPPYTPAGGASRREPDPLQPTAGPARPAAPEAVIRAPAPQAQELPGAEVPALYDAEVRDADAALGEALADLERMGLAERTALIVLGDHGQELGERGDFGAGEGLYEESLAVPLLVVPPGWNRARESGERLDAPVSLLDVHPTALALGGVAGGPELQGRSLLNDALDDGSPVLLQASVPGRRRSLRLGAYKLIVSPVGAPELYDLAGDRAERDNLWSARPLLQRTLRHVFSLAAAYETAWSRPRWGDAYRVRAAFAADLGP